MYFIDEIPNLMIKRKKALMPISDKDRKKGSVAILLTPSYESSKSIMNNEFLGYRYYYSYFMRRPVMYYIDGTKEEPVEESVSILEDYEKLFDSPKTNFVFNGLESDIKEVESVITGDYLSSIQKGLPNGIEFPETINVEVYRRGYLREPTTTVLYLESKYTFNRDLFVDYETYVKFTLMVYLINRANSSINKSLLYGTALVESGLYDYYSKKGVWPFAKNLKTLCPCIVSYMGRNRRVFYKDVILKNNNTKELVKLFSLYLPINDTINNVLDYFNIDRLYENVTNYSVFDKPIEENYYSKLYDLLPLTENDYVLLEDVQDSILKKMLYKDRIKTRKDMQAIYDKVKNDNPTIKYTYHDISKYRNLNLFFDTYWYNETYLKNSTFKNLRGYNIYSRLMDRLIMDKEINDAGYVNKTIFIPLDDWNAIGSGRLWMIQDTINPVSVIYKRLMSDIDSLKKYGDNTFVFLSNKGYFTINFAKVDYKKLKSSFIRLIKMLIDENTIIPEEPEDVQDSPKVIKDNIINKVEITQGVKIDSLDKEEIKPASTSKAAVQKAEKKKELVDKIDKAAKNSSDTDIALDKLDDDEVKDILDFLNDNPDEGQPVVTAARANRNLKLQNDLLSKEIKGKSIKDILDEGKPLPIEQQNKKIEPIDLKIDSVNPEWENLTFPNIDNSYNMDDDIVRTFESLSKLSNPLYIRDISVTDTSTSEDAVETYEVKYESGRGERFTVKLDIPKFIDGKYIKLRGNRKELPNQLFLMPIIKTDEDTVQIVSNYNKIFIRRFGSAAGKSIVAAGKLMKVLNKKEYPNLKVYAGMNARVCSKYELPVDYIDLSSVYSKIVTKNYTFYFNQDEIRKKYNVDDSKGVPFAYDTKNKKVEYYTSKNGIFSDYLALLISTQMEGTTFYSDFVKASKATKYTYSRASIMSQKIPLIVLCAYHEGLDVVLKKANIKYDLSEEKPKDLPYNWDSIRFKDGYLSFEVTYDSSLLLNGLRDCPISEVSISDMNKRTTYLAFLDLFGGRIIADGLDNFYDLMIDNNTYQQLVSYKLPTDYVSVLLYANQLLADNKYVKHTNIANTRQLKRKQQIVDLLYAVLAREYAGYNTSIKHGRNKGFSLKQSAVIDEFMKLNTSSDLSVINPLQEYESYSAVTPKGHSGMNSDRSYGLDKRSFDDSMFGTLSLSTGFAGNVGIVRQATIDANVDAYGRILSNDDGKEKELNPIKTLCMTEALTPFGTTGDDPMRSAMNFIQTSKHGMRCAKSDPLLVTTGADEALPYLTSNTFSFKSKDKGKVIEKTNDYMVVEYDNGTHDFISFKDKAEKNSSNGFYIGIQLDSKLKVGDKFGKNDILAYDPLAYSNKTGTTDNIEYNIGTFCKVALLNTDEGYEDSAIISQKLSEDMASEVILQVTKSVPKDANIYNMVKEGQAVKEGDTLFTLQMASDDEYVDQILRNLSDDESDMISELGRTNIKAEVTGTIQSIIIKRTCEKSELSDTLLKLWNKYEGNINKQKSIMKKYGIDTSDVESTDKLDNQGKLKKVDGLYIEINIKYNDKMSVGDKLIYYSAVKGVVKDIFPKGDEPYSDFRKNEKMDSLVSLGGINARMVTSVIKVGSLNKLLVELTRSCKDILDIPYKIE